MRDRAADPRPLSGFREGDIPLGSAALASCDRHAQTRDAGPFLGWSKWTSVDQYAGPRVKSRTLY